MLITNSSNDKDQYLQVKQIRTSTVKYKHLFSAFYKKSEVCSVAMQRQTCAKSCELSTTFALCIISIKLYSFQLSLLFTRFNLHLLAS